MVEKMPRFVDMAQTPEEINSSMPMVADQQQPVYPYGLCICLGNAELEKIGLDADCEVGDMLILTCMTKVTSVSKNSTSMGEKNRIELQITGIEAGGDKEEKSEDAEEEMPHKIKNPYK